MIKTISKKTYKPEGCTDIEVTKEVKVVEPKEGEGQKVIIQTSISDKPLKKDTFNEEELIKEEETMEDFEPLEIDYDKEEKNAKKVFKLAAIVAGGIVLYKIIYFFKNILNVPQS